jgi:steroid delta-isomerase-like uncharacterized protein
MADNKALTRRFYEEAVNQGKDEVIDELVAPDFVDHEEFPGLTPDRDGVKQFFAMFKSAFPDGRFEVEDLIEEGDKMVVRATIRGTHKGEFIGIPPTGKQITVTSIDILRIRDGQATEHWGVTDMAAMLTQLGVLPEPAAAQA